MKPYRIELAAGEEKQVNALGDFIRVKTADAPLTIKALPKGQSGRQISAELSQGEQVTLDYECQTWRVKNTSANTQVVTLQIGAVKFSSSEFTGAVSIKPSSAVTTSPDVAVPQNTVTSVIAENSNRSGVIIQNNATGVEVVRVGDGSVSATQGLKIPAGQSLTLNTTAELFAYQNEIASLNVSVLEF